MTKEKTFIPAYSGDISNAFKAYMQHKFGGMVEGLSTSNFKTGSTRLFVIPGTDIKPAKEGYGKGQDGYFEHTTLKAIKDAMVQIGVKGRLKADKNSLHVEFVTQATHEAVFEGITNAMKKDAQAILDSVKQVEGKRAAPVTASERSKKSWVERELAKDPGFAERYA